MKEDKIIRNTVEYKYLIMASCSQRQSCVDMVMCGRKAKHWTKSDVDLLVALQEKSEDSRSGHHRRLHNISRQSAQ